MNDVLRSYLDEMDKWPKILIGTPWGFHVISTDFCENLRNMYVPFPLTHFRTFASGRSIADARNSIIQAALDADYDYVMEIDADQYARPELFLELWRIIKSSDSDNLIASAWARLKTPEWHGRPCVFQFADGTLIPITEEVIGSRKEPFEADAVGTCGFLASTSLFRRMRPPWHRDVNLICEADRLGELYVPTEFVLGQDLGFSFAVREAGARILIHPGMMLEHEGRPALIGPST